MKSVSFLESESEEVIRQIKEIATAFEKWINLRLDTIASLRDVANYIGTMILLLYGIK